MLRLLPILLILLFPAAASAAPADIDGAFGRDGRTLIDLGGQDILYDVAVQPDGKVLVVGDTSLKADAAVARLEPDGSPDRTFSEDGIAPIEGPGIEYARAVAVQPDGKIVVAGHTNVGLDAAVWRLNADGRPDKGFGTDGLATLDSAGTEIAFGVAVQPDGRIVVAGRTSVGENVAVYRLTTDGKPDKSFDEDGARGIDAGGDDVAEAVALQPDGAIVVAGRSRLGGQYDPLVARLTTAGAPDESWGPNGWRKLARQGELTALAIQPDGRVVVAGTDFEDYDAIVRRLDGDGTPDEGFGAGGATLLDAGALEEAFGLALQPDGRIVVGGGTSAANDAVVWRLKADGGRDAAFAPNGERVLPATGLAQVQALAFQPGGGIILGGDHQANSRDVQVYRLVGERTTPQGGPAAPVVPPPAAVTRCDGRPATIVGTAKRDILRGTRGRDVIAALGGNDVIRGLAGDDVVCAGAGNDLVMGGAGSDRLLGGAGKDRLVGGTGRDRLLGGPGRDRQRQ